MEESYSKEYYKNNKVKWLTKVQCDICGVHYCAYTFKRHNNTRNHKVHESLNTYKTKLTEIKGTLDNI